MVDTATEPVGVLSRPAGDRDECDAVWEGATGVPWDHQDHRCRKTGEHDLHRCSGCTSTRKGRAVRRL